MHLPGRQFSPEPPSLHQAEDGRRKSHAPVAAATWRNNSTSRVRKTGTDQRCRSVRLPDQPLVTIGGGATTGPLPIGPLPIGPLPIGPLPIGALPIGALPISGTPATGAGGGWRTGRSAATAAPATPRIEAVTITNCFISVPIP